VQIDIVDISAEGVQAANNIPLQTNWEVANMVKGFL
jgi:hypothetical protein